MTLEEIAHANKMSLEEFFGVCWKWKVGSNPPKAIIREHLMTLATQGLVPLYVSQYINLFTCTTQRPN